MDLRYRTPPGYGDTFYCYAYNGGLLTDGTDARGLKIEINDGDFVVRSVSGLDTIASGIQVRDRIQNPYFSGDRGATLGGFPSGFPVLPEKWYPSDGYIGFDLFDVAQSSIGTSGGVTLYDSQLCFFGVRRRKGIQSDPIESKIGPYYEKPYSIMYPLTIDSYGLVGGVAQGGLQQLCYVPDYDFVMQRIRVCQTPGGAIEYPTPTFAIELFNSNGIETVSNVPIISQRMVNFNVNAAPPRNYFPTPPIMYRANSNIRFNIYSLMLSPTTLPVSYDLEFSGVRRYPCK